MRNSKESKIKKAVASVLIALAVSIILTSSVSLAQELDNAKSAIAYCSQPLKVKIGPVYDYRYFVYANKIGSSDLSIKIEKGFANSLENLYPGSKAQLNGKQITVKDSTSFILHDLGGGELALSGNTQFAPSEKCDELVAAMTAINGYAKRKLADDENLISAQMELVKAMTTAAGAIVVKDIVGYEPTPRTPEVPTSPYTYDATATVKYLEDNEYLGERFLDDYNNLMLEEEKKFPIIKDSLQVEKRIFLADNYNQLWLKEMNEKLSNEEKLLLKKYTSNSEVSFKDAKNILDIFLKKKLFKHSSDTSKWISLTEYLSKADDGINVEYKIVDKLIVSEYLEYADIDKDIYPHLQTLKKGTNIVLSETPIVPSLEIELGVGGVTRILKNDPSKRLIIININEPQNIIQKTTAQIVHEISHDTTFALKSYDKLFLKINSKPNLIVVEGLATFDQFKFMKEQADLGLPGYKTEMNINRYYWLKAKAGSQEYGNGVAIYEFIRDKFGQDMIDKIKSGKMNLEKIVDVNGIDSIFQIRFLTPLLEEINANADEFMKIYNKEMKIIKEIGKGDIENPDISKLNKHIDELDGFTNDVEKNSLIDSDKKSKFKSYVKMFKEEIVEYKNSLPEQRMEKFSEFEFMDYEPKTVLLNEISGMSAEGVNVYGGITKEKVPSAQFNAVEDAANKLLEKTRKIKEIGNNILTEKSLQSLNAAENSILKNKVPEELTKTAEVAKKSASGATAIAAGTAMVFALGPKFVEYGQDNNNPYLVATGETIEYSGIGLFAASAGATVAQAVGIALPQILKGLVLTSEGFLSGTVIGLLAVAFIEMVWCVINPFGALCFGYVQPTLALSKTKGFKGDKITYEISGFVVKNGIGNQEGKKYILTYQGSLGLQLGTGCTVSSDKCKGEFSVPQMKSDTIRIFAQDIDNTYKSAFVTFEKLKNQLTIGATVATDKSYLCMYNKEWKGETELEMACAKL